MAECLKVIFAVVIFLIGTVTAGQADSKPNDGPYIFWQSDSTAVVFYLCNNDLVSRTLPGRDSVAFSGFCGDDANTYQFTRAAAITDTTVFPAVSKIFAISDLHGEFKAFARILINSGIIDADHHWRWNDGHLVIVGDVFDRGKHVNECLWLIHDLERQAKAAGGAVHLLLGNHELMVLRGDIRYVNEKYTDGIVKKSRIPYEDLYGPDMAMGRWLRTLPVAIIITDVLFTHAGLAPDLVDQGYSMDSLNLIGHLSLDLSPARVAFNDEFKTFSGSAGPFWYRGYFEAKEGIYPQATGDDITRICDFYGVSTIVVGHSESDEITGYYDNRVLAIDVPVDELGGQQGLLIVGGAFYKISANGDRTIIK